MFYMKTAARFAFPALISLVCAAQSATPIPAFDAASVRPSATAGNEDPHIQTSPGSLIIRGMSLKFCIRWAYGMSPYQVDGPAWLKDAGFDISAKAAQPADDDHLRLMLRTLLAEPLRFSNQHAAVRGSRGRRQWRQRRSGQPNRSRRHPGLALQNEVGLKLEFRKDEADILVVDHAEKDADRKLIPGSVFREGFSTLSITSTSTGLFCDSSLSPSCSRSAVTSEGAEESGA